MECQIGGRVWNANMRIYVCDIFTNVFALIGKSFIPLEHFRNIAFRGSVGDKCYKLV